MGNELKINLITTSNTESLDDIEKEIDLAPDHGYSKGDQLTVPNMKAKMTLWSLVRECKGLTLESELSSFLGRIRSDEKLQNFIKNRDFHLSIVCYFVDRSVDLSIKKETLKYIASLNCSFGIDYYLLPEEIGD